MALYRKKPVVIQAFELGMDPLPDWFMDKVSRNEIVTYSVDGGWRSGLGHAEIHTLEGVMRAERGDWVIQGVKGEVYPCKPEIFQVIYEKVQEEQEEVGNVAAG